MSTPSPLIERMTADMEAAMTVRSRRRPAARPARAGLAMVLLAAAAVLAVVVGTSGEREREATRPASEATPPASAAGDVRERFGALLSAADPVPEDSPAARELRSSAGADGLAAAGYELRQATFPDGAVIALGLGPRTACLRMETASSRGGMACGGAPAPDRLLTTYGVTPNGFEVSGVLEDGFSDLRLELRDGSTLRITPLQGFFHVEVGGHPAVLRYRTPDGSRADQPFG